MAEKYAMDKVKRDFEQGWQGIEYKLNTVGSSRGDYPFVTVTIGLGTSLFEKMASISLLEVHKGGQGKPGNKKPVLFPKIVFLYDEHPRGRKILRGRLRGRRPVLCQDDVSGLAVHERERIYFQYV